MLLKNGRRLGGHRRKSGCGNLKARREIVMHDEANKLRAALRRLRAQLSRTMDIQMRMTLSGSIMQMEERLRELEEATARSE